MPALAESLDHRLWTPSGGSTATVLLHAERLGDPPYPHTLVRTQKESGQSRRHRPRRQPRARHPPPDARLDLGSAHGSADGDGLLPGHALARHCRGPVRRGYHKPRRRLPSGQLFRADDAALLLAHRHHRNPVLAARLRAPPDGPLALAPLPDPGRPRPRAPPLQDTGLRGAARQVERPAPPGLDGWRSASWLRLGHSPGSLGRWKVDRRVRLGVY